jgi:hypothetical protein
MLLQLSEWHDTTKLYLAVGRLDNFVDGWLVDDYSQTRGENCSSQLADAFAAVGCRGRRKGNIDSQ